MKKEISVVILTYNSQGTIEKCLRSLENQTNKDFEVLIIDDNSSDNTLNLIKKNINNYSFNIKFFRNGAHNISRGRNIGIKKGKTVYITFLDSDAYAHKNWINEISLSFNKNKNLALIGGKEIQKFDKGFPKGISLNDYFTNKITGVFWAIKGCNFAINKKILKGVYFDEYFIHNEETEFIERISKKFIFNYNKKAIVYHQPRTSPKKYLSQMYSYGYWRVLFSSKYHKFRLMDYYPLLLLLLSLVVLVKFSLFGFLLIPSISLIQSAIVLVYLKGSVKNIHSSFFAWLIKNVGWGLGTIKGVISVLFKS